MKIEHSEKGLETLTRMGTTPEAWGLTPIKFEKKIVPVMVWVECRKCQGNGLLYTVTGSDKKLTAREAMKALKFPAHCIEGGSSFYIRNNKDAAASACPVCPWVRTTRTGRAYFWEMNGRQGFSETHQEQGFVKELRNVEREVATVLWAKATRFDSRFEDNYDGCALCAKIIPSHRFVPVNGQSADGVIHGMWIGEDCARKFFGIKAFKPEQIVTREAR